MYGFAHGRPVCVCVFGSRAVFLFLSHSFSSLSLSLCLSLCLSLVPMIGKSKSEANKLQFSFEGSIIFSLHSSFLFLSFPFPSFSTTKPEQPRRGSWTKFSIFPYTHIAVCKARRSVCTRFRRFSLFLPVWTSLAAASHSRCMRENDDGDGDDGHHDRYHDDTMIEKSVDISGEGGTTTS